MITLKCPKGNLAEIGWIPNFEKFLTSKFIEKSVVLTTVESFMDVVKTSLSNQEPVYLRGFGSFIIKHRAEKTARDIHKEKTITIPAHNIPAFKPAKTFVSDVKK